MRIIVILQHKEYENEKIVWGLLLLDKWYTLIIKVNQDVHANRTNYNICLGSPKKIRRKFTIFNIDSENVEFNNFGSSH